MDSDSEAVIQQAAEALQKGCLVALPTETVYGLAAPIDDLEALKKVFTIKERPAFDPLIVHVASLSQAKDLCRSWPQSAELLARRFWPGPLTLVLPKKPEVSDLITSGLDTLALRMPNHPLALGFIEKIGCPVAAPSANKFGKTSPTAAEHVRREFSDDEVHVVDGGPTQIGLESTILAIKEHDGLTTLTLLRPGMLALEEITQCLAEAGLRFTISSAKESAQAPGGLENHYMPSIPLLLVPYEDKGKNLLSRCSKSLELPLESPMELRLDEDPKLAARQLYGQLRELSDSEADCIFFFKKPEEHSGPYWDAILDRITKASSLNLCTKENT